MQKNYLEIENKLIEINDDIIENMQHEVYFHDLNVDEIYINIKDNELEFRQGITNVEHFIEYFENTNILNHIDLSPYEEDSLITLVSKCNLEKNGKIKIHHNETERIFKVNNKYDLPVLDFNVDIYTNIG